MNYYESNPSTPPLAPEKDTDECDANTSTTEVLQEAEPVLQPIESSQSTYFKNYCMNSNESKNLSILIISHLLLQIDDLINKLQNEISYHHYLCTIDICDENHYEYYCSKSPYDIIFIEHVYLSRLPTMVSHTSIVLLHKRKLVCSANFLRYFSSCIMKMKTKCCVMWRMWFWRPSRTTRSRLLLFIIKTIWLKILVKSCFRVSKQLFC